MTQQVMIRVTYVTRLSDVSLFRFFELDDSKLMVSLARNKYGKLSTGCYSQPVCQVLLTFSIFFYSSSSL